MIANILDQIDHIHVPAELPNRLLEVHQTYHAAQVEDVELAVVQALDSSTVIDAMHRGSTVAVGVGSRGIAHLSTIVQAVITRLRVAGLDPFIFPCMGSHGGATASGQRAILAEMGVTEASMDCTIRATMEARLVGQIPDSGPKLYQDVNAAGADYTFLINRVKSHTDFTSTIESGLSKMAVIGMGKQVGARQMHNFGAPGFQQFLKPAARIYEAHSNLIGGLAIVENANQGLAEVAVLHVSEIGTEKEERLLELSRTVMAKLPFDVIDVLVLRQIGKDISGTGLDTNVIARLMIPRQPESIPGPDIGVIVALDLTNVSHGNASGMGLLNVVPARFLKKINWEITYINAVSAGVFGMQRTSLPMTMTDDRRALQLAMRGCGVPESKARVVFIQDTLNLDRMWVSPSMRDDVDRNPQLSVLTENVPLSFTDDGTLKSPWQMHASSP